MKRQFQKFLTSLIGHSMSATCLPPVLIGTSLELHRNFIGTSSRHYAVFSHLASRFANRAAGILLLLTLGLGFSQSVWGWTIYMQDNTTGDNGKWWGAGFIKIDGNNEKRYAMTPVSGQSNIYSYSDVPSNSTKVQFYRAESATSEWWNWTNESSIPSGGKNLCTITADKSDVSWSYFTPSATLYFDNSNTEWSKVYAHIGHASYNSSYEMTSKVSGTANLYQYSIPAWAGYEAIVIKSAKISNSNSSIYTVSGESTSHEQFALTESTTITTSGTKSQGGDNGYYYSTSRSSGMLKQTVTITTPTNGTITVTYTDETGTNQTRTSGNFDVAQTCIIKVTATGNDGYHLKSLSVGGSSFTSANTYIVRSGTTISATFEETKHTAAITYKCGDEAIKDGNDSGEAGCVTTTEITAPDIPGYTFSSWSTLPTGAQLKTGDALTNKTIKVNLTTDGLTLTANYEKDKTMFSYAFGRVTGMTDTQGTVTSSPSDASLESGTEITLTATPKNGYAIAGWYSDLAGNTAIVDAGITSPYVFQISENTTVYVKFVPTTYNYTFEENGGSAQTDGTYTIESNDITLPTAENISRTGYDFAGWYDNQGLTGKAVSALTTGNWGDKTFYAKWTAHTYTVTFAGNGNTGGSMSDQPFTYDVAQALTANAFTKSYQVTFDCDGGSAVDAMNATYSFNVWQGSNGTNYSDMQSVSNLTADANGTFTMTAQWTGGSITLPSSTKAGFALEGWYDEGTKVGNAGASYTPDAVKSLTAHWDVVHVYLEGRTKIKNAEGQEIILNETTDPWDENLKTIEFDFNEDDKVYYLNTRCTTYDLACDFGNLISLIKLGLAVGDGEVTPYGCNTANYYRFTDNAKGTIVNSNQTQKFEFRQVENYESGAFARRGPVMYRYNPTNNNFDYCAPLLTLTYSGDHATMTGYTIAKNNANAVADGLKDDGNKSITYQYKKDDGEWQTWNDDNANITAEAGTYKLRAMASGNNEFGQPVKNVISNEITVTVTKPTISAQVTHVNKGEGSLIRVNDEFTITPAISGVPAGQTVQVCYKWKTIPKDSKIDINKNIFNRVDETSAAWTAIDVAGDYAVEISVSDISICENPHITWDTYTLPIHVKGDEITVYAKLDKSINDWNDKYVYYWKDGVQQTTGWAENKMTYIGKDSLDYEWYSYNITGYKTYAGGKILFNDGTTTYGKQQTTDLAMPNDDAFYFIKTIISNGKRTAETLGTINIERRVILQTDTAALYQYVTINLEALGVFFPTDAEKKYTFTVTDPNEQSVELNAKKQFTPSKAGNYTVTIKCEAEDTQKYEVTNTFTLRVKANPLTLTASQGENNPVDIGTSTQLTVRAEQSISGTQTFTVTEPGTNDPITFSTKTENNQSITSDSYTLRSSGEYIFSVVLTDGNNITGKALDTITVAAKTYYIKHPFVDNKSEDVVDGDWEWRELTYNEIDGTYQYSDDDAYYHKDKVANIENSQIQDATGLKKYTIANPDNLADNTKCIFVYDVTLDSVTVYDLHKRLYRIKSVCNYNEYFSNPVTYSDEGNETQEMSFFAQKDGQLIWQSRTTAAEPWQNVENVKITTTATASGIYTATPTKEQTDFELTPDTRALKVFTQLTDTVSEDGSPTNANGLLTQFNKQNATDFFNHYWVRYVTATNNAKRQAMATVGNDINPCLATTLPYYELTQGTNVRYAYDNTTNHFSRTFLAGSNDKDFLRLYGQHIDTLVTNQEYNHINSLENSKKFDDGSDWVYTTNIRGSVTDNASATAIVTAKYNNYNRWILAESGLEADPDAEQTILSKDVTSEGNYNLKLIYDYKTNRLTAGMIPTENQVFNEVVTIDQMMVSRTNDLSSSQFKIADNGEVIVVNQMTYEFILTQEQWKKANVSDSDPAVFFWMSLPYPCRLKDIYGLGHNRENAYKNGKFEIQRYRGDLRDEGTAGSTAWRRITGSSVMEANRGYVLALYLEESDFKTTKDASGKEISAIHLYFPSYEPVNFTAHPTAKVPEYTKNSSNIQHDWNVIGVPTMTNGCHYTEDLSDDHCSNIYKWTWANGGRWYEPVAAADFTFQSTHAYMVQGHGTLKWNYPDNTPAQSVAARRISVGYGNMNLQLDLKHNDEAQDHLFIKYRENGTRDYEIGRDLLKIENAGRAQLYAVLDNKLAAICLGEDDDMLIPMTVEVPAQGTYTIALKDFVNTAEAPTVYDAETGQYTNLNMMDFEVELNKGTYANRFFFLMRKAGVVTDFRQIQNATEMEGQTVKFIRDDKLFILRSGSIFDATGKKVK